MIRWLLALLVLAAGVHEGSAQDISANRIRAHVRFLASDLLEGRGVGTRGGDLTVEYLAAQLELAGARPAGEKGSYYQQVPLMGIRPLATSRLSIVRSGGEAEALRWLDEFVGLNQKQTTMSTVNAEAVFVGHGITAPEFGWDDYAGVDVKGKVVVLFTGEPPSDDPAFFDGRALTYYGRWTYKFEEATRRGAAACLIVHTTGTASYGWDVVKSSWGREDMAVRLDPGQAALSFAGWISGAAGDRLFAAVGKSTEQMLQQADTRGFRAVALPVKVAGSFPAEVRPVESRNVMGVIPGSDPVKKEEVILFTAHWDHLGTGGAVNGDSIYNGAVDNATGCAILLELARAWQQLEPKPRRSAAFLFVTAEENGLRGSEYFAGHPLIPPSRIAVNLNYDAIYPFGRTTDVVVTGAEKTTVWPVVENVAERFRLTIQPDARPEAGLYFRSDHFSFAKVGVPAFSVKMGNRFAGQPAEYGSRMFEEYNGQHYHQPSDEFKETWDFSGMQEMARFGFAIALDVANSEKLPARTR
jgi:Zn-dependent M28 family amino/carboxypeptidase